MCICICFYTVINRKDSESLRDTVTTKVTGLKWLLQRRTVQHSTRSWVCRVKSISKGEDMNL